MLVRKSRMVLAPAIAAIMLIGGNQSIAEEEATKLVPYKFIIPGNTNTSFNVFFDPNRTTAVAAGPAVIFERSRGVPRVRKGANYIMVYFGSNSVPVHRAGKLVDLEKEIDSYLDAVKLKDKFVKISADSSSIIAVKAPSVSLLYTPQEKFEKDVPHCRVTVAGKDFLVIGQCSDLVNEINKRR